MFLKNILLKNRFKRWLKKTGRIDVLVNNAAINLYSNKFISELSLKEWNKTLSVNLTGIFLMVKYCVSYLIKSRGNIINIASTRALMSEKNTEAYSASKGGVVALTHALAVSLSHKVRVNCISPGWIDTRKWVKDNSKFSPLRQIDHLQHPCGRVGKPEDIASLVAFLISNEAEFITGMNYIIDGGMTIKMNYEE